MDRRELLIGIGFGGVAALVGGCGPKEDTADDAGSEEAVPADDHGHDHGDEQGEEDHQGHDHDADAPGAGVAEGDDHEGHDHAADHDEGDEEAGADEGHEGHDHGEGEG